MASRVFLSRLSRSKALTFNSAPNPSSFLIDPLASSQCLPALRSLGSSFLPPTDPVGSSASIPFGLIKLLPCRPYQVLYDGHKKSAAFCSFAVAQSRGVKHQAEISHPELSQSTAAEENTKMRGKVADKASIEPSLLDDKKVISFSPLEGAAISRRVSALTKESLKINRFEISQKITLALIPALLLMSKNSLTTSLLIFSVYWQIYCFFKEIFLDYVHQEVTRKWVVIYFQLLLLILAKDTILCFDLV